MKFVNVDENGCWIWKGSRLNSGYGTFYVEPKPHKSNHNTPAHRASYLLHKGPISDGLFVCHTCDVKACVNPDHLFLGTNSENLKDHLKKGGSMGGANKGQSNGRAALTDADVLKVRTLHADGRTLASIGREYGLTRQTIWGIVHRKNWTHV